jgi:hypothetical protein
LPFANRLVLASHVTMRIVHPAVTWYESNPDPSMPAL